MNTAIVTTRFQASHAIRTADGFESVHGHNWTLLAEFTCDNGTTAGAEAIVHNVLRPLENSNLNELPQLATEGASAEQIARFLHGEISKRLPSVNIRLRQIALEEEPGCWARYFPGEYE